MFASRPTLSMVGIGALILAALACTCGPLSALTGAQATLEAAATQIGEGLPTLEAQLTQQGPITVPTIEQAPPPSGERIDPNLPVFTADDGYETTLVQRLDFGETGSATFTDLFEAHNWLFEGEAGRTVEIVISGGAEGTDTRAKLLDPNGEVLVEEDDTRDYDPWIVYTLPADGLYTVRMDTWDEGPYTITINVMEAGAEPSGTEVRQWAFTAFASTEYSSNSWSAPRATGAPDVATCGDDPNAWASASGGTMEWLQLNYLTPVIPTQINIVESYNPGAVYRVEVVDTDGGTHVVYEGTASVVETCPRVFTVEVSGIDFPVQAVILYLDQSAADNWCEIDAVELVGRAP